MYEEDDEADYEEEALLAKCTYGFESTCDVELSIKVLISVLHNLLKPFFLPVILTTVRSFIILSDFSFSINTDRC